MRIPSSPGIFCRDDRIRTCGPLAPSQVRYQAAPHPVVQLSNCFTIPKQYNPQVALIVQIVDFPGRSAEQRASIHVMNCMVCMILVPLLVPLQRPSAGIYFQLISCSGNVAPVRHATSGVCSRLHSRWNPAVPITAPRCRPQPDPCARPSCETLALARSQQRQWSSRRSPMLCD